MRETFRTGGMEGFIWYVHGLTVTPTLDLTLVKSPPSDQ